MEVLPVRNLPMMTEESCRQGAVPTARDEGARGTLSCLRPRPAPDRAPWQLRSDARLDQPAFQTTAG